MAHYNYKDNHEFRVDVLRSVITGIGYWVIILVLWKLVKVACLTIDISTWWGLIPFFIICPLIFMLSKWILK